MERVQIMSEAAAEKVNRSLDRLRAASYTSRIGGRYLSGVPRVRGVRKLCAQERFWKWSADMLRMPIGVLAFLSMSALDVAPGDPGLGEHVDYPHHVFPDSSHLSAQFILSLDGTDEARAPLWIGEPTNLVCMKPGEVLIFGGNTLHGVHPNTGDRPRTTLLWSMGPNWVRPMLRDVWEWNAQSMGIA